MSARLNIEVEAMNLGWAMAKDKVRSTFGRDGRTIIVAFDERGRAIDAAALLRGQHSDEAIWYDGGGDAGKVARYVEKNLREFSAVHAPPASLLDTVTEAQEGGRSDLTDKLRRASATYRTAEHHWPADCLAEAADAIDSLLADHDVTVRLIGDLVDPDDCHFDHHGGCQAHGYLALEPGELCPVEEAKRWLDRNPAEEDS